MRTPVETSLLGFKYFAEGHKAGFFHNYLDLLTLHITSAGTTVIIEFTDEGTLTGKHYFNRIASSFDMRVEQICAYREHFGYIDVDALVAMKNPDKILYVRMRAGLIVYGPA